MEISRAPECGGPAGMSEEERQMAIDRLEEQMLAAAGNLDLKRPPNCATRCWRCAAKSRWLPTKNPVLRAGGAKMRNDKIIVRGAREHNLKNVSVELPRDSLIVMTGLSGSGKSSLAFDTIYAEGQRRYVESLSSYARQFLGQMEKPDVDSIDGLSPAISIDQKTTSKNPRSTVGTVTEIHDYLRLLYARAGVPHCPCAARRYDSRPSIRSSIRF